MRNTYLSSSDFQRFTKAIEEITEATMGQDALFEACVAHMEAAMEASHEGDPLSEALFSNMIAPATQSTKEACGKSGSMKEQSRSAEQKQPFQNTDGAQ